MSIHENFGPCVWSTVLAIPDNGKVGERWSFRDWSEGSAGSYLPRTGLSTCRPIMTVLVFRFILYFTESMVIL